MSDSKIRFLKIIDILKETDEYNPVTAADIIKKLECENIKIERKAVYSVINSLIEYGYDIEKCYDNQSGYYLNSRDFEEWELKVLIDAVVKMKFLNEQDIKNLIRKIKKLTLHQLFQ